MYQLSLRYLFLLRLLLSLLVGGMAVWIILSVNAESRYGYLTVLGIVYGGMTWVFLPNYRKHYRLLLKSQMLVCCTGVWGSRQTMYSLKQLCRMELLQDPLLRLFDLSALFFTFPDGRFVVVGLEYRHAVELMTQIQR